MPNAVHGVRHEGKMLGATPLRVTVDWCLMGLNISVAKVYVERTYCLRIAQTAQSAIA